MSKKTVFAGLIVLGAMAAPANAHHSIAMFDRNKTIVLEGTVKQFQWTNPHSWLQVMAPRNGKIAEWSVECNSPNVLRRSGWTRDIFKPGDKVVVRMNPMRDGTAAGLLTSAKTADGRTLGDR